MNTIKQLLDNLDSRFLTQLAEPWDNTGLLLGDPEQAVARGMTALTLTEDVADEAIAGKVDLIVVHHPILFRGAKQLTTDTPEGRVILKLARHGVAVYSPHTRFDNSPDGINEFLAKALGLVDIRPIRPNDTRSEIGAGRFGKLASETSIQEFGKLVSNICRVEGLHVVDGGQPVSQVAIACGAAGEFLTDAIELNCDAFVVGECRFHSALEARDAGVSLFVPGHYGTERPAVEMLAKQLDDAHVDIDWFASNKERDPLVWHSR